MLSFIPNWLRSYTMAGLDFLTTLFIFAVGLVMLLVLLLALLDVTQNADAIRKNYPFIGRFRYFFSTLGEFFRQYFFAMDREEMPFNRAEREWVYRSAKGEDNTVAFGSTKNLIPAGTAIFANCAFPQLDHETAPPPPVEFGPYCNRPYATSALINISAMSYGALSGPAVRALSKGAKMAGIWLNTGEGGLSPFHLEGGSDVVFQIGTAKYGVRDENGDLSPEKLRELAAIPQIKMFEIKMSQGAKPGKGGILPAEKVTPEIAKIRGIPVGQASISPNRHPEIDSATGLLDYVNRIRDVVGKPVGVKAVIGGVKWIEAMCEEVNRRGLASAPDFITVDSGDGGTGAAPMPLMDNVGLPVKESLPLVVDVIRRAGLADRIRIIASGKLITPAEVAWAYCAGADMVVSARGFMLSLGCIQALKCNKNTCPTGITTHNKRLQKGLNPDDKKTSVMKYANNIQYGVNLIAHSCGVPHPRALKRHHCRISQGDGRSVPMSELFPLD